MNKEFKLSQEERRFIRTYSKPPQIPLTIKSINELLNKKFWEKERKRDIKNYLKSELNYSYKKGGSTTYKGGSKEILYQKSIFSSRLLVQILEKKLIINIDESVFNRDLKQSYSWLPKGITSQIINTVATGRWSIIAAVLSNGEFLAIVFDDTGNAEKFSNFLKILKYAISNTWMKEESEWIIVLDNASIHHSNLTLKTTRNAGFNMMFLPAYSPSLAPVEFFFRMIKNEMRKSIHTKEIWFNKLEDRIEIYNAFMYCEKTWIRKMWIESIQNAKQSVIWFYL